MPSKIRSSKSTPSTSRSSSAILKPLTDPELAPPVSRIKNRPLRPEPFRPERNSTLEADGEGLTRYGRRFREVFAEAQGISAADVDLGLVRLAEALNADSDRNLKGLAGPQVTRTERGTLTQVRMLVNTGICTPWILNGRALRRLPAALGGEAHVATTAEDHELYSLPVMTVGGAEDVLAVVSAQRELLGLDGLPNDRKKLDRLDSIVQHGVLNPPDVVLTQLVTESGEHCWTAQAAEGAQRLLLSLLAMDTLANRSTAKVSTSHWFDAEPQLRDFSPKDLRRLEEDMRYPSSDAAGYFPGADIPTWLDSYASIHPGAVAFQLLRTMEINLVIAIAPDDNTAGEAARASTVLQELIRSYHVPGKMKDPWQLADVQGLIAIGAIDELRRQGRISDRERSAWLGEQEVPWSGSAVNEGGPAHNRLRMVTKLLATLTAQNAAPAGDQPNVDSLEIVNEQLRRNSSRVHSDERARVAASQAAVALHEEGRGNEGTISAALIGTFNHPWFWRAEEHLGGSWVSMLDLPLPELAAKARAELAADVTEAGPAQRALAALGGVGLMVNPALVKENRALSRTGRGGGGKTANVSASDPSALLQKMVAHSRGLDQLEDAASALTASAQVQIPVDRETDDVLEDLWLRQLWFGDVDRTPSPDPDTEFTRRIQELVTAVESLEAAAAELRDATVDDILEVPTADRDPQVTQPPLYEVLGIPTRPADEALEKIRLLQEFFTLGKLYAQVARGTGR